MNWEMELKVGRIKNFLSLCIHTLLQSVGIIGRDKTVHGKVMMMRIVKVWMTSVKLAQSGLHATLMGFLWRNILLFGITDLNVLVHGKHIATDNRGRS